MKRLVNSMIAMRYLFCLNILSKEGEGILNIKNIVNKFFLRVPLNNLFHQKKKIKKK